MPLFIADTDGTVVYRSLSAKERDARDLASDISLREIKNGLFRLKSRHVLVRELFIRGKKQLFFMDFDRFADMAVDVASSRASLLLDEVFLTRISPKEISLADLTRVFAEVYAPALKAHGVNIALRFMAKDARIKTSVSALLFCLSLMVRAFCKKGATVYLGAEENGGKVRFFAESESGVSADEPLASAMLYEAASVQGFFVEFSDGQEIKSISLTPSPLDISLYGFKSADLPYLKKVCELCLEFII